MSALELLVRVRRESDFPTLLTILRRSHETQGHPRRSEVADARTCHLRLGRREIGTARQHRGEHQVDAVLMVPGTVGGD